MPGTNYVTYLSVEWVTKKKKLNNVAIRMARAKKAWTFNMFKPEQRWIYLSSLKGLLLGMAVSLVLTTALLGSVSGQRTQQQKQGGPSYTTTNSDEKIPTSQ